MTTKRLEDLDRKMERDILRTFRKELSLYNHRHPSHHKVNTVR